MDRIINKIVNKLGNTKSYIYTIEDVRSWIQEGNEVGKSSVYKIIHSLISKGHIQQIRNGLYIKGSTEEWEDHYWEIVKKSIQIHSNSEGVIGGYDSARIHNGDSSIGERLIILTRNTSKIIKIQTGYELHFRTIKQKNGKNMFPMLLREAKTSVLGGKKLKICSLEYSLLELMTIRNTQIEDVKLIIRSFLKRYNKKIDMDKLGDIADYKYITAINRLREYTKTHGYTDIYDHCLKIIHTTGKGCFVSVNTFK